MLFPLRMGVAGTKLVLRTAADVAGFALKLGAKATVAAAEAAARAATRASDEVGAERPAPPLDDWAAPAPESEVELPELELAPLESELASAEAGMVTPEIDIAPAGAEIVADEPAPEPTHVSEEPELVEEFAEPGAEDGAGASVEIAEPWPGYRGLSADDVIARIDDATPAELAGIELYETANRHRQTVLEAAGRSLRSKTGQGSPDRRE